MRACVPSREPGFRGSICLVRSCLGGKGKDIRTCIFTFCCLRNTSSQSSSLRGHPRTVSRFWRSGACWAGLASPLRVTQSEIQTLAPEARRVEAQGRRSPPQTPSGSFTESAASLVGLRSSFPPVPEPSSARRGRWGSLVRGPFLRGYRQQGQKGSLSDLDLSARPSASSVLLLSPAASLT